MDRDETRFTADSSWNDIVGALAKGRAVAFVGAGASNGAGLPGWKELLNEASVLAADTLPKGHREIEKIEEVLRQGDLQLAAALLKHVYSEFGNFVHGKLNQAAVNPSPVHYAVARLPFSQAITTNFDSLLERAYPHPITDPIGWTEADPILDRLQRNAFCLIKLHGHFSNPSRIVLTDDDFRTIQERSQPLRKCLETIFLTKHVIFIGHSLRDPDLLGWLSDLKTQFPLFGPHFAFLAKSDVTEAYREHCKRCFNIRLVEYQYEKHQQTRDLTKLLTRLHGEVALARVKHGFPSWRAAGLDRTEAKLSYILEEAAKGTGAYRADICFFHDQRYVSTDTIGRFPAAGEDDSPSLRFDYSYGPTDWSLSGHDTAKNGPDSASYKNPKPSVAWPHSVAWTCFHLVRDGIKIDNVHKPPELFLDESGNEKLILEYRAGDTGVHSEIAVPIHWEGSRLGVLNLESNVLGAFTDDHMRAARVFAAEIGRVTEEVWRTDIYREGVINNDVLQPLRKGLDKGEPTDLQTGLRNGALLDAKADFRLFLADYQQQELRSEGKSPCQSFLCYGFERKSFASLIFRKGQQVFIEDRNHPPEGFEIDEEHAAKDSVGKQLVGVPLLNRGVKVGVLVAWSVKDATAFDAHKAELLGTTARLLGRTHYLRRITPFSFEYELACRDMIDFHRGIGDTKRLNDWDGVCQLLNRIRLAVGVNRVRLLCDAKWADSGEMDMKCLGSIQGKDEPGKSFAPDADLEEEFVSNSDHRVAKNTHENPFIRYIRNRVSWSSSCMLLYPDLLYHSGAPTTTSPQRVGSDSRYDPAADLYGRDPQVGWYVAPLTRIGEPRPASSAEEWAAESRRLLGLLVVDNTRNYDAGGKVRSCRENDFRRSRTWHELLKLKLNWYASVLSAKLYEELGREDSGVRALT